MEQVVFMSSLLHQGIIQAMKANYRKSMLHSLLAAVGKFKTATEFAKPVTVDRYQLDAAIYLLLYVTLHVSGIYMPIFRSIRLYTLYTAAYGVQH